MAGGVGLLTLPFASRPEAAVLCSALGIQMTPLPMKAYPQTLAAAFRQRGILSAVAKLVAWSHWGTPLLPQWEDLARTEAPHKMKAETRS